MRSYRLIAGVVIALAFIGYLMWSTLAAQAAACHVCVVFGPGRNCATASAATSKEALRAAQTTACGTLARGMNDIIACENRPSAGEECTLKRR